MSKTMGAEFHNSFDGDRNNFKVISTSVNFLSFYLQKAAVKLSEFVRRLRCRSVDAASVEVCRPEIHLFPGDDKNGN